MRQRKAADVRTAAVAQDFQMQRRQRASKSIENLRQRSNTIIAAGNLQMNTNETSEKRWVPLSPIFFSLV